MSMSKMLKLAQHATAYTRSSRGGTASTVDLTVWAPYCVRTTPPPLARTTTLMPSEMLNW
jgi:hypothetical protein